MSAITVGEHVTAIRHENEKIDTINRDQVGEEVLRGVKFALAMYRSNI